MKPEIQAGACKTAAAPRQVLFVCTGNTCRSPMAAAFFNAMAGERSGWRAGSAGVAATDGQPASAEASAVMAEVNLDLSAHRGRRLTRGLIDAAGVVVVMSALHGREVRRLAGAPAADKVRLLSSYSGQPEGIADPFGGSRTEYRETRDHIRQAVADLWLDIHGMQSRE